MKSIQEKYAYLQQTSWKDMASTTLGHVSAEKYGTIEAAYDAQIASEQSAEQAPAQTGTETGSNNTEPPTENVQGGSVETLTPPAEVVEGAVISESSDVQLADASFGENDENEVGLI